MRLRRPGRVTVRCRLAAALAAWRDPDPRPPILAGTRHLTDAEAARFRAGFIAAVDGRASHDPDLNT
ncbi:MAG: hypothetical protein M3Y33_16130 [Actinomycetota bacterium]|nr:hypothetical protein [Actinomycetota bacterium]